MKFGYHTFDLEFIHTFTVSSFSRNITPVVYTSIEHEGIIGYGEASLPPYLGENQQSVIEFYRKINLESFQFPFDISRIMQYVDGISANNNAAKAGIDLALHDLVGKLSNKQVSELYSLPQKEPLTSYTIGLDTIEKMQLKTEEAKALGFKILKIKIGTENDLQLLESILSLWHLPFSVDVNQGWKDKKYAYDLAQYLEEKNVLFIEQPFAIDKLSNSEWLTERSNVPIIADENIKRLTDLDTVKNVFDGINVKLMKTTGILEAYQLLKEAKAIGLKTVTGCMAESSLAVAAMSHLSSLADWVDLDGPFLMKNDPFNGLTLKNGNLCLSSSNGIGVEQRKT